MTQPPKPRAATAAFSDALRSHPRRAVGLNDAGYIIGECHPRAVLSDHECDLVRQLREEGVPSRVIAEKMEVSVHTVYAIAQGRRRGQTIVWQRLLRSPGT